MEKISGVHNEDLPFAVLCARVMEDKQKQPLTADEILPEGVVRAKIREKLAQDRTDIVCEELDRVEIGRPPRSLVLPSQPLPPAKHGAPRFDRYRKRAGDNNLSDRGD